MHQDLEIFALIGKLDFLMRACILLWSIDLGTCTRIRVLELPYSESYFEETKCIIVPLLIACMGITSVCACSYPVDFKHV